nr:right-handed parallel beta-helix repeat-containing protein [Thermoflexales bacterium]
LVVSTLGLAGPMRASASNVICSGESLIAAIEAANATIADDTLNLEAGCTYWLATAHNLASGANGLPVIADSAVGGTLTIHGNGAKIARVGARAWLPMLANGAGVSLQNAHASGPGFGPASLSSTPDFRILMVAVGGKLTLDGLNVQNGNLPTGNGGGILNAGALTVTDSIVSGNAAAYGGGILNQDGTLTVIHSAVVSNSASLDGAGINSVGTLVIISSTFSGNTAQGLGGGVIVPGGVVTVIDSAFAGNWAFSEFAGGAGMLAVGSVVDIVDCVFSDNHTPGAGGGLFLGGTVHAAVDNSTFANNAAGVGGGLWSGGTVTVTHSTLSGNSASTSFPGGGGGGIAVTGGVLAAGGTLVAGNTSPRGPDISGALHSLGYNLIGDSTHAIISGTTTGNLSDAAATPLNLGPLQDNGGPTLTMALGAGSVAIDAGDPAFAPPPDFDQRGPGFPRIVGGRIDIGAYEK